MVRIRWVGSSTDQEYSPSKAHRHGHALPALREDRAVLLALAAVAGVQGLAVGGAAVHACLLSALVEGDDAVAHAGPARITGAGAHLLGRDVPGERRRCARSLRRAARRGGRVLRGRRRQRAALELLGLRRRVAWIAGGEERTVVEDAVA